MRATFIGIAVGLCVACNPHGSAQIPGTTSKPVPGPVVPTTPSTTLTEDACRVPAPDAIDEIPLDYPGEEFAFDDNGHLVTAVDWAGTVARMDRQGTWDFLGPYDSNELAGVDFDVDGNFVFADEGAGALIRMNTAGSTSAIDGSIFSPNSVAVSDLNHVYVTAFDAVYKLDLQTGAKVKLTQNPGHDLDGLAFSPDFTQLWFNEDDQGEIFRIELDGSGDLVDVQRITSFPLSYGHELDGMTTDICGNLYVIRTDGRISRYLADGTKQGSFLRLEGAEYASALHFGSGVGGWELDHLYAMDRYGSLYDIPIGIPGAPEPHLP